MNYLNAVFVWIRYCSFTSTNSDFDRAFFVKLFVEIKDEILDNRVVMSLTPILSLDHFPFISLQQEFCLEKQQEADALKKA